jgi:hypothetical protein
MGPRVAGHSHFRGRGAIAQRGTAGAAPAVPTRGLGAAHHACWPSASGALARCAGPGGPSPPGTPTTAGHRLPSSSPPSPHPARPIRLAGLRPAAPQPVVLAQGGRAPGTPTTAGHRLRSSSPPSPHPARPIRLAGLRPAAPPPVVLAQGGRAPWNPHDCRSPSAIQLTAFTAPRTADQACWPSASHATAHAGPGGRAPLEPQRLPVTVCDPARRRTTAVRLGSGRRSGLLAFGRADGQWADPGCGAGGVLSDGRVSILL